MTGVDNGLRNNHLGSPSGYFGSGKPLAGGSEPRIALTAGLFGQGRPKPRLFLIASGRTLRLIAQYGAKAS